MATRWLLSASALLGVVVACAQTQTAADGGDCFSATDCNPGLICAVGKDGRRACTKDLTDTTKVPGGSGSKDAAVSADAAKSDAKVENDAQISVQDAGIDAPALPDAGPDTGPKDAAGD